MAETGAGRGREEMYWEGGGETGSLITKGRNLRRIMKIKQGKKLST